ncbi:MAG TPA: zf-HC2 domain-containing protein [Bryobacteraceae bacterium]|nr:zf-HC2 domain-containing protein [Bryobacteraceae bacterium]
MNRYKTSHPDAECLIQYADGELPSREAAQVRTHLEACWRCRAEVEDIQETINDYVRYEQTALDAPPDPPAPWDSFSMRLDRLVAKQQTRWNLRWTRLINAVLPNRRVLASALAAAGIIVFAVIELNHPPAVNAAQLLERASEGEARVAYRPRLRIRTRTYTFVRPAIIGASRGADTAMEEQLRSLFVEAKYSWDNPLSARSFAAWRAALPERHDEVVLSGSGDAAVYQVRTSTRSNSLQEATVNLRSKDLGIVSGTFRFRSSEWVEMTALPDEPTPSSEEANAKTTETASTLKPPDQRSLRKSVKAAEELRVIAAIHSAGADLGEQIELDHDDGGNLVLTATGLGPERRAALQNSLSALPVSVRFRDPHVDLSKPSEPQDTRRSPNREDTDSLQLRLQEALGGATGLARFTDQVLDITEAMMVHVHDLRKLAVRFSPGVEAGFGRDDRLILDRLRDDHVTVVVAKASELQNLLEPLLRSLRAADSVVVETIPKSPTWQDATETLFASARQLDDAVTRLLAGGGPDHTGDLVIQVEQAVKQMQATVDWYRRR